MVKAAKALQIAVQTYEIATPDEFENVFSEVKNSRASAVFVQNNTVFSPNAQRFVDFALNLRLPMMGGSKVLVSAGGLMFYGPDVPPMWKRSAYFVDKILKGAKPADLPVEQPMKFEFVINLKTAKQIGLTIPPNVLARADKVIR